MKKSVRNKIIDLMKDGRERTTRDVYLAIGCSMKYASNVMSALRSEKMVSHEYFDNFSIDVYQWIPQPEPQVRPKVPRTEQAYAAAMHKLAFEVEKRPKPRLPHFGTENYEEEKTEAALRRRRMLIYIDIKHPTVDEIADALDVGRQTVQADIKALRREGVVTIGKRPARYAVKPQRMAAE